MTYMQELDRWTDTTVLAPLFDAVDAGKGIEEALENARKAIRIKVLESYRNGAKRCPNCQGKAGNEAQRPLKRPYRRGRD